MQLILTLINKSYFNLARVLFALSDILLLNFCLLLCCFSDSSEALLKRETLYYLLASSIIWIFTTLVFNLYSEQTLVKHKIVKRATMRSVALYILSLHVFMGIFSDTLGNSKLLFLFYAVLIISFIISRAIYAYFEGFLSRLIDSEKPVNVFAIASIGGHWVQLLRLMPTFSNSDVSFMSTKPSLKDTVSGHRYYLVPDANRNNKLRLIKCCLAIGAKIMFARPQVIITTGAAPGLFGIVIGKILGVKTVWIDSVANVEKLSLSGKIASKIADRVYTQWEHLATSKIIFAGNILDR